MYIYIYIYTLLIIGMHKLILKRTIRIITTRGSQAGRPSSGYFSNMCTYIYIYIHIRLRLGKYMYM